MQTLLMPRLAFPSVPNPTRPNSTEPNPNKQDKHQKQIRNHRSAATNQNSAEACSIAGEQNKRQAQVHWKR